MVETVTKLTSSVLGDLKMKRVYLQMKLKLYSICYRHVLGRPWVNDSVLIGDN